MYLDVINDSGYSPESVFEYLYSPGTSCLLESSSYHPVNARYSIIATHPDYVYKGNSFEQAENRIRQYQQDNFYLKEKIKQYVPDIPFVGGAIGYVGYDAVRGWQYLEGTAKKDVNVPEIYLLFYSRAVVFDHFLHKIILINEKIPDKRVCVLDDEQELSITSFMPTVNKDLFKDTVRRVKRYIRQGDIYQANLSHRLEADVTGNCWELYKTIKDINPSPFGGYFNLDGMELISCSPERLVTIRDDIIQTRPIAGTYPRGKNLNEDVSLSKRLLLDPKEQAEHIMLVDLERNDLGRICVYGSVEVTELMQVESYSHVHHIISNIKGRLKRGADYYKVIKSIFPGGTITGCPKISCMNILDRLEPIRRNLYTGSMGYFSLNGNIDLNIIIRTILKRKNRLYLQVGAGIVADSDPEREYNETLYKAEALIKASGYYNENCVFK